MGSEVRIDWTSNGRSYSAREATVAEVDAYADQLAAAYNHPSNAALMGHAEPISPAEVVDHYAEMIDDGARAFLLFCDDRWVGDADLRGFRGGAAEFAFMIGAPDAQGQGLGTRYALMLHAFGFRELGLERIYASVVPANTASRRVFEKLGYREDHSPEAREFADEPDDVTLVIDRATFDRLHAAAAAEIAIVQRH